MKPYVGPIEKSTLDNGFFRKVLFTGKNVQLVVMCLQPKEEIGNEMHDNVDQFFRIESG
nr:cupin domain-containing protein [Candidatus Sigynarchaeota archaeon]